MIYIRMTVDGYYSSCPEVSFFILSSKLNIVLYHGRECFTLIAALSRHPSTSTLVSRLSLPWQTCCNTSPGFMGFARGTDPFSLLERRAKGNGEPFWPRFSLVPEAFRVQARRPHVLRLPNSHTIENLA